MSRDPDVYDVKRELAVLKNTLANVRSDLIDIGDSIKKNKTEPPKVAAKKSAVKRN
jgi:hypothetical protein